LLVWAVPVPAELERSGEAQLQVWSGMILPDFSFDWNTKNGALIFWPMTFMVRFLSVGAAHSRVLRGPPEGPRAGLASDVATPLRAPSPRIRSRRVSVAPFFVPSTYLRAVP